MHAWQQRFQVTPIAQFERQLDKIAMNHRLDSSFESPYRGYTAYAVLSRPTSPISVAFRKTSPIERHAAVMAR